MKRVGVEFARVSRFAFLGYAATPWQRRASMGALLAGAVLLSAVTALAWQGRQELEQAQAGLGALRQDAARAGARPAAAVPAMSTEERKQLNLVVRQLNTPWPQVFQALERHTPHSVALLSMEPDAARRSMRLHAEARTLDALLAYAAGLRDAQAFAEVILLKHETNLQDPNRPVQLGLELRLP